MPGQFFYGDTHDIAFRFIPEGSVDLIYCDPPWGSNREHNHFFPNSAAQGRAYETTWTYASPRAQLEFDLLRREQHRCIPQLEVWHNAAISESPTMYRRTFAYLTFMAVRLIDLERTLRPLGSIIIHCDAEMNTHLRQLLDVIFPWGFINQINWQRHFAKNDARRYGRSTDTLLWYVKGNGRTAPTGWTWNPQPTPYTPEDETRFRLLDGDTSGRGRCYLNSLHLPGHGVEGETRTFRGGGFGVREIPPPEGRRWPSQETIDCEEAKGWNGDIGYSGTGWPYKKEYLDEMPGKALQDTWTDLIMPTVSEERTHPTAKPVNLLRRIVEVHSSPGDLVLDAFCGGGSTLQAAEERGRRWIGIDVAHEVLTLVQGRLRSGEEAHRFLSMMDEGAPEEFCTVRGWPCDKVGADWLMEHDAMAFQWWAVDKVRGRPIDGKKREESARRDGGVDGEILLSTGRRVLLQATVSDSNSDKLKALCFDVEKKKAVAGILICGHATKGVIDLAAGEFFVSSGVPGDDKRYPKIQVLTPEDLLAVTWTGPVVPGTITTPFTPWV